MRSVMASLVFTTLAYLVYRYSPHTLSLRGSVHDPIPLSGEQLLTWAYWLYVIAILAHYHWTATLKPSRALLAARALLRFAYSPLVVARRGLPDAERLGLLVTLLKVFFAPLMLLFLHGAVGSVLNNGLALARYSPASTQELFYAFNAYGFTFMYQLILLADVGFFTIGYLVEHPYLRNEIRSVDATLVGWVAAIACYPPFNGITVNILGGNVNDFPQFSNPILHLSINGLILALMLIYASASVALKWKASNLTHRGIVCGGPYRYVRHPAYVTKNIAWWLATVPALSAASTQSWWAMFLIVGSSAGWAAIYVLRALTEEDH
ncbi:unnamed protein product, partial [Phaeothamnion confervicola]